MWRNALVDQMIISNPEYMEFMFNQQKSEDDQTVRTEHEEVLKTESFRDLGVYSTKLDRY